jgi:hypothetical protein
MATESLQQAVAKPRFMIPGLVEWVKARAAWVEDDWRVELSDAGRRAQVLARLVGNRDRLLESLPRTILLLRRFLAPSASTATSYPNGDGVCLAAGYGVLTFDAAVRDLGSPRDARTHLDGLLETQLLSRGLVLSCVDCGRKSFYDIDNLKQLNICPRCGGANELIASRWKQPASEPSWFYDIHGALRELLVQDGDVPILAAAHLRSKARDFRDVGELDFEVAPGKRMELDLLMLMDGRLVIGEAKKRSSLGTGRARQQSVAKLVQLAHLLMADDVVLASTDSTPWARGDIDLLKQRLENGRGHLRPKLRVITGLGSGSVTDVSP